MASLREFRARELARLWSIRSRLVRKYPDRVDRIDYLTRIIATKLEALRSYTLADLLFTIYLASTEFEEFGELMPSEEEVSELLKETQA